MLVTMVVMEGMVLVLVMLMMMMLMCVAMLVQGLPFVQAGHCLANLLERDCLGKLLVLVQNWILIGRWFVTASPTSAMSPNFEDSSSKKCCSNWAILLSASAFCSLTLF